MSYPHDIAVIGAGLAGLTAARWLQAAGHAVTLFDKGRRPGGRLATRRVEIFNFNHGCQFFTARDPGFAAAVRPCAAPWPAAGPDRLAGVPDMAAIATGLAAGLTIRQGVRVTGLTRQGDGWRVATAGPDSDGAVFDTLLLALPAPQAATLLDGATHPFAAALNSVSLAPCWAALLGFATPVDGPDALAPAAGPIGWIARENSRPGAGPAPVAYTIHATADWSKAHLQDDPAAVSAALTAAAGLPAPAYATAHRWRYALADRPLGEACLWDPVSRLGLCGDWCLGGRLEAAYLSGAALGIRAAA